MCGSVCEEVIEDKNKSIEGLSGKGNKERKKTWKEEIEYGKRWLVESFFIQHNIIFCFRLILLRG